MSTWPTPENRTLSAAVTAAENSSQNTTSSTTTTSAAILNTMTTLLWYAVPPVLLVSGTFGNVMIVVVMRGMRDVQSTACLSLYFTALAVSDQCMLLMTVCWFWTDTLFVWPPTFFHHGLLCRIPKFVWYTSTVSSAWILVAMTYQRVTSVVVPHRVTVLCTVRRGKLIIATIVMVASALNFHFLFTFTYSPEYEKCQPQSKFTSFVEVFVLLDLSWYAVIPFLSLLIGNTILIGHVIKYAQLSHQMRVDVNDHRKSAPSEGRAKRVAPMTVTLILTSSAFLLLTLPTCVFDAYRGTLEPDITDRYLQAVLNLAESVTLMMWIAVSASNFYLYLLSGSKFREETKLRLLCWRHRGKAK